MSGGGWSGGEWWAVPGCSAAQPGKGASQTAPILAPLTGHEAVAVLPGEMTVAADDHRRR